MAVSITMISDDNDIFILADSVKIARRGWPDTPQAGTWVMLEPGWQVLDVDYPNQIEVSYNGEHVHSIH